MTLGLPAALDAVAARLTSAGIAATTNRAAAAVPGVVVQLEDVDLTLLSAIEVRVRLVLVVPDRDDVRALAELDALLADVLQVIDPRGPITPGLFPLPTHPTALPCLVVPAITYVDPPPAPK